MFKCRPGWLVIVLSTPAAWGQKPSESAAPTVSPRHEIATDRLGNVVRISGNCHPKSEKKPNGYFEIRLPRTDVRGVQAISGKVAVSGATIDRRGVQSVRLIKSTVDHLNVTDTSAEFATHSQEGLLKLPLVAEKDSQVVVLVYLETANGTAGFRYFLSPGGLSFEPVKKKEAKK